MVISWGGGQIKARKRRRKEEVVAISDLYVEKSLSE